jgi:alanine dehydrogenase
MKIGIRKEDKGIWERRSPFVPEDIRAIREKGIDMVVESNPGRVFSDTEYVQAGVPVQSDLNDCDMIFGIKEIHAHATADDGPGNNPYRL